MGAGDDGVRSDDDLRWPVTVVDVRVEELRRQLGALRGAREDSGDESRVRRRLE